MRWDSRVEGEEKGEGGSQEELADKIPGAKGHIKPNTHWLIYRGESGTAGRQNPAKGHTKPNTHWLIYNLSFNKTLKKKKNQKCCYFQHI